MRLGPTKPLRELSFDQLRRRRWVQSRRRFAIIGTSLGLVVAIAVWLVYFSSFLAVHHLEINGTQAMSVSEIKKAADVQMGGPLLDADLGLIRSRVEALAGVQSASVSRSWPQTVTIDVIERVPVAVVSTPSGMKKIDASGVLFGQLSRRPAGLPLITLSGQVDKSARLGAATVASSLPTSFLKQVQSISVRTMDDIRLNLTGGRQIRWGSSADSDTKAQVATVLLRQHPRIIDVSVPSNPTTSN